MGYRRVLPTSQNKSILSSPHIEIHLTVTNKPFSFSSLGHAPYPPHHGNRKSTKTPLALTKHTPYRCPNNSFHKKKPRYGTQTKPSKATECPTPTAHIRRQQPPHLQTATHGLENKHTASRPLTTGRRDDGAQ